MQPLNSTIMQPNMTLCKIAIEECLRDIGPAWVYTLRVSKEAFVSTRTLARELAAQVVDNPFAPYLNLLIDPSYVGGEWSISTEANTLWSPDF
jgi:hypothetical protein